MYARILVPTDGSGAATRGVREAIALAKALHSRLVLLHAIDDFPITNGLVEGGRDILDAAARLAQAEGMDCETVLRELDVGHAADAILAEAREKACNLIVMGTHGRRCVNRALLGSVSEKVLRRSPVPVMLVREPG
ncbi:MAG TPA: universal stress protein [Roseateles sp.]